MSALRQRLLEDMRVRNYQPALGQRQGDGKIVSASGNKLTTIVPAR